MSTECYAENLGGVTHRFLLLELRRSNRKDVCLRLDRRRGQNVSLIKFFAFSGVTKANDRVGLLVWLGEMMLNCASTGINSCEQGPHH